MALPVHEWPMVVVGAGPAGLCAALEAAEAGVRALVVDENERGGGQLYKQIHRFFGSRHHGAGKRGFEIAAELVEACGKAGVEIRLSSAVLGCFPGGELLVEGPQGVYILKPQATVIATGASEKSFPFPGWTLPGVMGAGAAQTLLNVHGVLPGKRVLMVGAGNVGLIVSYQLLQAGAEVVGVVEAEREAGGYMVHLQRVRREGVPLYLRHRLLAAEGDEGVEAALVESMDEGRVKRFRVDALCLAVGLVPQVELAAMRGCRMSYARELGGFLPWHDRGMRTGVTGVYVAGDAAGVEEASIAMDEGRLAAVSAAEDLGALDAAGAAARKEELLARLEGLRGGDAARSRREAKARLCAG